MKQEELQKALESIAKGGIHVAGDFVVEKHVEHEVANVEAGGIGIQIVNAGKEELRQEAMVEEAAEESTLQESIDERLKAFFYGNEDEARQFLSNIQWMKPTQITTLVKKLVAENKISELSCRRDLWRVLYDAGLYEKSETNWNKQVR